MANVTSLGIGSGILSSNLVDQLVSAERSATDSQIQAKTQTVNAKISAFGKVTSALTDLRTSARLLSQPGALNILKGSSSDSSIGVSVDSSSASPGSYSINVQSLASAQSLASGAVTDPNASALGTGSLKFTVGGTVKTITVDSSNNSLNGLAKTINQANFGVSASVVNTGSGYRLVLSSSKTGKDNAMTIDVTDSDGNNTDSSGLSQFAYNSTAKNLTQTVAAGDAQLTVNGISVTRSSNTVSNVIDGVTLNLSGLTSSAASVTVSQDTSAAAQKVQDLVDKYNTLQSTVSQLTAYDPSSQQGSVLTGDSAVSSIMNQVNTMLNQVIPGLNNSNVRSLADVGIATDPRSGQLQFDQAKFVSQLQANPQDVEALFAQQGRASDPGISVTSVGSSGKPGTFGVNITQAATHGAYAGSVALGSSVTIDSSNDSFSIKADNGTAASITLTQGTYTPASLVQEIQNQLDSNSSLKAQGQSISVGLDSSNHLVFTSGSYGSSSNIAFTAIGSGSASSLGISNGSGTAGQDVSGTVNGQPTTGDGQTLTVEGSGDAKGMVVQVTGNMTGNRGTITSIKGVGQQITDFVTNALSSNGVVTSHNNAYQQQIDRLNQQKTALNNRMDAYRKTLVQQFTAADQMVNKYNSTLSYLQQQFGSSSSSTTSGMGGSSGSGSSSKSGG